ncbi:uncharacterized protein [Chaetodon trifascialis]|uniref:uncharacterized protein n=1 Tax=Chaetodon trifascialis TaxID=109706 RepID=UPI0039935C44
MEASSPVGSTTDEETDEESEPEPLLAIRRKVSFADAFGLNLVSVKEFDNAEATESEVSLPPEREATRPLEEFYMSCLFTVPSSPEELDRRLQAQMVELESIELLPGTTTIRGTVRVVNLCYSKSVYARMTLDRWASCFDLAAEYVPGSSDRKTDRFTFKYTLVPPLKREGTRVELCLRYDTPVGTFWANNKEMNYVLFCHQTGHVNEHGPHVQEESASSKSKRSCLKASRRGSAEEKTRDTSSTCTAVAGAEATDKVEEADRKMMDSAEIQSLLSGKEHKPLVDSNKSRHRATHLAHVQDCLSQTKASSRDSDDCQKVSPPLPSPWGDSAAFLHKCQKKQTSESPQVLTYHQIPLLTLDWNNDASQQWGTDHMDDIWSGRAEMTLSAAENIEDTPSVNDMWETFLNGSDDTTDRESSVCDAWQAFLNGPSCTDHSGVPESEWLQTAASVSPSNDKEPKIQYAVSSREYEFQVGADTPTTLQAHTSAACQLLPAGTCETSLANVALNTADHQPAEACISSQRYDNTAAQDASQRSETNSVTDTPQEFSLEGATPVSEGPVDGSAECHKHAAWVQEREGIIGGAEGKGEDEPFTPHTADLVTSSGESETTDMTATAESQNASAVDRISQGARLAEGLSSSREGQVTGSTHNKMDDTLAFRGTIRQGTKHGERFVVPTSRQGAEEGIANSCTENKVSTGEEIFRPQKTEECEISQRYADEKQDEEFRLNQNSENPWQENESDENEIRPAQSPADEFMANQACEEDFKQSQVTARNLKWEDSENKDVASNDKDLQVFRKTEVEFSYCAGEETKRRISAEGEIIQVLNEEASQLDSSRQSGSTLVISEAHNKQSRPIQAGEEQCIQKEEEDSILTQIQENAEPKPGTVDILVSNQSEEGKCLSCDGKIQEQQEINPSAQTRHTVESREMKKVQDPFRPFPTDKCNPGPVEVVEMRQIHSQDNMKGQKEDVGHEMSPEEVTVKEGIAKENTSTEPQCQPERSERIEEDVSQRDKDERVSTGKLKIEALGELMGNVGIPQGERQKAPAQLKEQELSAEVESSPRVEYKKLSEGTKAIIAENTVALEEIESGLEEMLIERFGEDLVRGVWEEVFDLKVLAWNRDANVVDGMGGKLSDIHDVTRDCHLLYERDFDDAFDSGVFSLTELPSDPNPSLCQGLEQTSASESNEHSPKERNQPLATTEQAHFLSESQTDANSSAHLSQGLVTIVGAQSGRLSTESGQSSPKHQEICAQIKERSVTRQETGRQIEGCAVAHKESFNRSNHSCPKHLSPASEKLKESNSLIWWSMLYILSHITRLLICVFLVAGFFFIVFLCDFPAFFALYVFSLSWWFYKWKRHRVTTNKGMVG